MDLFHGDIKADNIMITKEGTIKLIDFGFAGADNKSDDMGARGTPHVSYLVV